MKRLTVQVEILVDDDGEHCAMECRYGQDESCGLMPSASGTPTDREGDRADRGSVGWNYYRCRACLAAERRAKEVDRG